MEGRAEYCQLCEEMKKQGGGPLYPCSECEFRRPDLVQANFIIWELWGLIRTQWRTAGFGPVGLDFGAVVSLADIYGIDLTPGLIRKLRLLEDLAISASRKAQSNPKEGN